jgi:cysteine-rich repeat protein
LATARWFWSRYRLFWIAAAGLLLVACAGSSGQRSAGVAGDDSGSSSDGNPVGSDQAGSLGSMGGAGSIEQQSAGAGGGDATSGSAGDASRSGGQDATTGSAGDASGSGGQDATTGSAGDTSRSDSNQAGSGGGDATTGSAGDASGSGGSAAGAGGGGAADSGACGDGKIDSGEDCDDSNVVTETCGYGAESCMVCDSTCHRIAGATSYCGDGHTDAANSESCDGGNDTTETCAYGQTSCTVCDATCKTVAGAASYCGDGTIDSAAGETCDDSNTVSESCAYGETSCSVCDASCKSVAGATSYCGDSKVDSAHESCDDGNTTTETCSVGQTSCSVCNTTCHSVSSYGTTSFTMASAYCTACTTTPCSSTNLKQIVGAEPSAAGKYPVAVYLTGTSMNFNGIEAQAFTQRMAQRGFVAATVEYANSTYPSNCTAASSRAQCIFDPTASSSAINAICGRAKADCSKGVVVSGFSQGANLASMAKNFDSRVLAAYLLGDVLSPLFYDLTACLKYGAIQFDQHEMRCISGENDGFGGGNPDGERTELTTITNLTCHDAWTCLQSDASGWGMVKATDVTDGTADHCYFILNGSGTCANTSSSLDTKFTTGSYFWSLDPNLDWLASFAVQ